MRTTLTTISAAAVLSAIPFFAVAESPATSGPDRALSAYVESGAGPSSSAGQPTAPKTQQPIANSGKLIGTEVRNSQNAKLGKVHELAIDLESGRVVEVIVATGGMLGIGEKLVGVPPAAFVAESTSVLRLDTDRERLKSDEALDGEAWESNFEAAQVARVYRKYGIDTYFYDPSKPSGAVTPSAERIGHVEKASKLAGFAIKNKKGETLGKVDDLIVDVTAGKVVQVVVLADDADGDKLNFIQPHLFRYNSSRSELVLDMPKAALSRISEIRQGTSRADVALTAKIKSVLRQTGGLSTQAQNIEITTFDGVLILNGAVESDSEREMLAELASRYVVADNIVNRLGVNLAALSR